MRKPPRPLNPFQTIALTFLAGIVLGTVLLSMPFSTLPGKELSLVDALFMATSALCITGLAVVDIGSTFTLAGQIVMLALIQLGGLGILTFGTAFAVLAGRRIGVSERLHLATQLSVVNTGEVTLVLRRIVKYTLVAELTGVVLLFFHFAPIEGAADGLYHAVFFSINAFNNAGFSLYPDSLMRFADDAYVNLVVAALVVTGGLGFLVQASLILYARKRGRHKLDLNTSISLWTAAVLLLIGFVVITLLEWNNPRTMGALPLEDRLTSGFFQSVTPRSGGFNTLDYGAMTYGSLLVTIMLMFVGSNPGSTGGGIKTTTFFVLVTSVWSMVRGRGEVVAFRKRIDQEMVLRAGVVAVMSLSIIVFALFLLTITEQQNLSAGRLTFLQLTFESFSAFCTVGLSMNATGHFSDAGRLILSFLMYVGRIGPLAFAIALSSRPSRELVHYPADRNIQIG